MHTQNTSKICNRCSVEKPLDGYYAMPSRKDGKDYYCADCRRELQRAYFYANKERMNEYSRNYYRENREQELEKQARHRQKLRSAALLAYGGEFPACACCGESVVMFLTIDHVNNDGAAHRREFAESGNLKFLRWLRDNNYPDGFQLLCYNCNIGKYHNGGVCPHQTLAD